ncbi:unnamed protein product [Porites lobata]|uniref:Uncharacterized protein n=1 Tax=Porites lobata TaxID=104759 RepID=A0ABN8N8K3_9CNID|nr:unnamed protein product [Porites lobata]
MAPILEQDVFLVPCNRGKREHWLLPMVLPKKQNGEEEGEEIKEEDKSEEEDKGVKREEKRGRKKDKKYRKGGSGISLKWTTKYELLPKPTGPKLGLLFVTSELQRSSTQFMDPILTLIGLHGKRENCRAQV